MKRGSHKIQLLGVSLNLLDLLVIEANGSRHLCQRDAVAASCQGRPFFATLVRPVAELPLVFVTKVGINLIDELQLARCQMLGADLSTAQADLVVLTVVNKLLPAEIVLAPKRSRVDQVQQFAGDRPLGREK